MSREEEQLVRETYERVPYPSAAHHHTHPDHVAALAIGVLFAALGCGGTAASTESGTGGSGGRGGEGGEGAATSAGGSAGSTSNGGGGAGGVSNPTTGGGGGTPIGAVTCWDTPPASSPQPALTTPRLPTRPSAVTKARRTAAGSSVGIDPNPRCTGAGPAARNAARSVGGSQDGRSSRYQNPV